MTQREQESEAELLERMGDNAALWAAEFNKTAQRLGYPEMDEGWLIGWFANAIEHSHAIRSRAFFEKATSARNPNESPR